MSKDVSFLTRIVWSIRSILISAWVVDDLCSVVSDLFKQGWLHVLIDDELSPIFDKTGVRDISRRCLLISFSCMLCCYVFICYKKHSPPYKRQLVTTASFLCPENIASSRLAAPGYPRMVITWILACECADPLRSLLILPSSPGIMHVHGSWFSISFRRVLLKELWDV